MEGPLMNSNSVSGKPATIEVLGVSDKKFKAVALSLTFKDSTVLSTNARIVIYQGSDSLVHPSMRLRYNYARQTLTLGRSDVPLHKAPFSSSYFGIDFNADAIRWDLKSDSLDIFTEGSAHISPMVIESHDFYDPEDFPSAEQPEF